MHSATRRLSVLSALLGIVCASPLVSAQAPAQAVPTQMPAGISQSLNNLADQPAAHTGFVFDRSMLQLAQGLLRSDDPATKRAAASLSSIAYDNYRYPQPAAYLPQTMSSISAEFQAAGWKHLVDAHGAGKGATNPVGDHRGTITDLWLHFSGSDIDGVTVLARGSRDMNLVQVACDLRPLDLLRLSGHFGIPKIDPGAVMVPAPDAR